MTFLGNCIVKREKIWKNGRKSSKWGKVSKIINDCFLHWYEGILKLKICEIRYHKFSEYVLYILGCKY